MLWMSSALLGSGRRGRAGSQFLCGGHPLAAASAGSARWGMLAVAAVEVAAGATYACNVTLS